MTIRYSPSMSLPGNRQHMANVLAGLGASPGIRPSTAVADQVVAPPAPAWDPGLTSGDLLKAPSNMKWFVIGGLALLVIGGIVLLRK